MIFRKLKRFSFIAMIALIAVLLVGCGNDNPEELLAEAKAKILVSAEIANLKSDINLQNKVTIKDSKNEDLDMDIVWTVTTSDFFAIEVGTDGKVVGKVTRPEPGEEQAEVTLTATLTYKEKTTERKWTVYIAPMPESEAFSIAEAIQQPIDTVVTIEGVVVYIMAGRGFFLRDETATVYVYADADIDAAVEIGSKLSVTGAKGKYFDLHQIKDPSYEVVAAAPTGFDPTTGAVEISVKDADAKAFTGEESIPNYGVVYTITGVVEERGDYKDLYIVGAADGKFIQFYYGAGEDVVAEIKGFVGKTIEVTALTYDHHSGGYWRILAYPGTAKEVETVELTDQEKVDRVAAELGNLFKENQEVLGNLVMAAGDALDDDITITWTSSHETIINLDGTFTAPEADTNVALTATVKLNDAEAVFEVTVIAKMYVEVTSILAAINKPEDEIVAIEGNVTYVMEGRGYFVNDETASIYVYVNASFPATVKPGAKVKVVGTKKISYDLAQIITPSTTVLVEGPAEFDYASKAVDSTILDIDAKAFAGTESILNYGVIYKFTGVVELRGSYNDVVIVDPISGKHLYTYYKAESEAMDALEGLVGKNVEVTALVYDHHSGGYWRVLPYGGSVSEVGFGDYTDQDKVELTFATISALFEENQEVTEDLMLLTSNPLFDDVTILWTSSHEEIIAIDGTFVAPTEDTTVTLGATISIAENAAVFMTYTVDVLAKAIDLTPPANLFFSEYVEGTGYNKAMEIYNNEGVDVVLDGYTVELYANGATELSEWNPPIALTGTLKAGETLVIVTSDERAEQALKDVADMFSGSINHNGDDVYLLKKGDVILDSFGQFGFRPEGGGYVSESGDSTKDMTWVRKPSVTTGDTIIDDVFDPSVEWIPTSTNDYSGLGSHTIE